MVDRPDNNVSYLWRRVLDVPIDLFVSWHYDRYISDHRRWGRDANTMTHSRNRQVFYMGGHAMHLWELNTAQHGHGDVFVPNAPPVDAEAGDSNHWFRVNLLCLPNPDVCILYAGLVSDLDQTEHEFSVRNPQRPNAYSTLS